MNEGTIFGWMVGRASGTTLHFVMMVFKEVLMNIKICDVCMNEIRKNSYTLALIKESSIFHDEHDDFDICESCRDRMVNLYTKNREKIGHSFVMKIDQ